MTLFARLAMALRSCGLGGLVLWIVVCSVLAVPLVADSSDKKGQFRPITPANLIRVNCYKEFDTKDFTALWYELRPYAYSDTSGNETTIGGIVAVQLQRILATCCSTEQAHSLDYEELTKNTTLRPFANAIQKLLIFGNSSIGFPMPTPTRPALAMHFVGVVPSPGVVYMVKNAYEPVSLLAVVSGAWVLLCFVMASAAIAGILIWAVESYDRKHSMFSRDFLPGIYDGFWFSIVTMTSVGFGDITPRTKVGKFFGLLWMMVGTVSLALFTATITTSLTTSTLNVDTVLRGAKVAAVAGSEASKLAILNGAKVEVEAPTAGEAINAVLNGSCEGVLLDQLIAGDLITGSSFSPIGELRLAKLLMSQTMYGIQFSPNRTTELLEQCADLVVADQEHETYLDVEELISALQERQSTPGPNTSTASIYSQHHSIVYITCYALIFVFLSTWVCDCLYRRSFYPKSKRRHNHHGQRHHHVRPKTGSFTTLTAHGSIINPSETTPLLANGGSIQNKGGKVLSRPQDAADTQGGRRHSDTKWLAKSEPERTGGRTGQMAVAMSFPVAGDHSPIPEEAVQRSTKSSTSSSSGGSSSHSSSRGTGKSIEEEEDEEEGATTTTQPGSPATSRTCSPPVIAPKQVVYMQRPSFSRRHGSSTSSGGLISPGGECSDPFPNSSSPTPTTNRSTDMEAFVLTEQGLELEKLEMECQRMLQAWSVRRRDTLLRHRQERANLRQEQELRSAKK